MQRNYRFEIISVSREENSLSCSTEWDKSGYFTPSTPPTEISCKYETRMKLRGRKQVFTKEMKETVISLEAAFWRLGN